MSTNGKLDPTSLKRLSVGGMLTPAAADSFERWRVAASKAGVNLTITSAADAYRLYEIQERIFTERYQPAYIQYAPGKVDRRMWNGKYWFRRPGTAAAAVPGTSNHGWAIAIDIANVGGFNSQFYEWLAATGPALGWTNDEGRSVNEAWHWRYTASTDHGGGTNPAPTPEEEDDMPLTDADIQKIWAYKNPDVESSDIYAINRAARDGTVTAQQILDLLTPGKSGVKPEGDILARLGRIEAGNTSIRTALTDLAASVKAMASAVAAVPTAVWAYKNSALENADVYEILRKIRDAVVGK